MWCEKGYSAAEGRFFQLLFTFCVIQGWKLSEKGFGRDRWVNGHWFALIGPILDTSKKREQKKKRSTFEMKVEHAHKQPDGFEMIGLNVCMLYCRYTFIYTEPLTVCACVCVKQNTA